MNFEIGNFRKNVMKTIATKPAKVNLRVVSKNTTRTNVAHYTIALKRDVGFLFRGINSYILGIGKWDQEQIAAATLAMGDIGYDLTILGRALKCKTPTATKKIKLVGTRTAALLILDGLTTDMLAIVEQGLLAGPKMTTVKKMVVLPNEGGKKVERDVATVDVPAELAVETDRQSKLKSLLALVIDLYWRLAFDMFQAPPLSLFADKLERLQKQYPAVEFEAPKPKEAKAEAPKAATPVKAHKSKQTTKVA
jgi:hypothetical protein